MTAPSVSLLLGLTMLLIGLTVSAVFLSVSPKRELYFRRDSVSLSCVYSGWTVDGWTVRRTTGGLTQTCGGGEQHFGRTDGASCIVSQFHPSDSGVYWCETSAGQWSDSVNISVSDHSVLLEFPNPVTAGSDVTLRCKTRDSSTQVGYFFRNGSFFGTGLTGEFIINNVQHSDEGLYWCSTGLFSQSSKTWLSVKGGEGSSVSTVSSTSATRAPAVMAVDSSSEKSEKEPSNPDSDTSSLLLVRLLCHLAIVSLYFISTILMVSIYCSKRKGNNTAITMEIDSRVEGGQGRAVDHDYVTTVHDF